MTGTASYTLTITWLASLAIHLALAELELSCQLVPINIPEGEGRERTYLAVNPHGQVPQHRDRRAAPTSPNALS